MNCISDLEYYLLLALSLIGGLWLLEFIGDISRKITGR